MKTWRILYAEDEPAMGMVVNTLIKARPLAREIEEIAPSCKASAHVECVYKFKDFLLRLSEPWDLILLDLTFPDSSSEHTLEWLDQNCIHIPPVIVITGSDKVEDMENALAAGALRFFVKESMHKKPQHLLLEIYQCIITHQSILKHHGPKT